MTPHIYGTPPQEQIALARMQDIEFLRSILQAAQSKKHVDLHLFKKFNQNSRPSFRIGRHKHVLLHRPKRLSRILVTLVRELKAIYGRKIASHWLSYFFAEQFDVELQAEVISEKLQSDHEICNLSRHVVRNSGLKRARWFQAFWLW